MAAHIAKRAELVAEIVKLRKQQLETIAYATFVGWANEQEAAYRERSDRLALLVLELEALDGTARE